MNPIKVLNIEDEEDYQMLIKRHVSELGFQVESAGTGTEGLKLLDLVQPDLLILDINLPDTDGFTLCRSLRQHPRWGELPILMLTVRSNHDEWLKGLAAGSDDYLDKPFDPPELLERVQACLNGRPARLLGSDKPEHRLIESALAGNRSAFRVLMRKYRDTLYNSMRKRLANAGEADELVSVTFIRAFEHLRDYKGQSSFSTWLYAIANHVVMERYRSQQGIVSLDEVPNFENLIYDSGIPDTTDPGDQLTSDQVQGFVQAMETTPRAFKKAMELFYVHRLSAREIGKRLHIPTGTVLSRIHRGRLHLEKAYARFMS